MGRWRWWRSWGCAGSRARRSPVAASGACGPWPEVRDGRRQRGHPRAEGPALAGRHGGGGGGPSPWKGPGPPGRLPLPRRGRGQLHGVRRQRAVLLLRLRRGGRRPGLHPEVRGAEPPGGHRAAGRQPRACAQGRQPSSRTAASRVRRGASPRARPADGGGALLRRAAPASHRSAGVPGLAGRRPRRRSPPRSRLCAGRRAAAGPRVPRLLPEAHQGLRAVHGAGSGAVRRDGRRSRRLRRPRPLACGTGRRSRPDAPVPGVARPQTGAGPRASRPRAAVGGRHRGPVRLGRSRRLGVPDGRRPGHPGG